MLFEKFGHGINLGGYLSQYEIVCDPENESAFEAHLENFIREADIEKIASWGFDHVRIPMDARFFYDRESGALSDRAMQYLDRTIEYCEKYGLSVILDLHFIWGHVFGSMETPSAFMTEETLQAHFLGFWTRMAEYYKDYAGTTLLFELFNEIADATGYVWNRLCKEAVGKIREVDEDRWILIGSNDVNSVDYLDRLDLLNDPYVFYNFHYYEPNCFTHQKAHFSEEMRDYGQALTYPGDMTPYLCYLAGHPEYQKEHKMISEKTTVNDRALMEAFLLKAKRFVQYSGKELMCTEYGVIDSADENEAVKWLTDFCELCDEMHVGHSMWNYKELDFELVNVQGEIVRPAVLNTMKKLNG